MQNANESKTKTADKKQLTLTILGAVLCLILIPILIINITLIVKSYVHEDKVPTFGGYCPLIVLTDSMLPEISSGDLIICQEIDPADVKVGDVISFFDPASKTGSVVTHRVIEIVEKDGVIKWRTRGDNNNTEDRELVSYDDLVGVYRSRIAGAGNVAMFLQSTPGLIVCIACPLALLVGYDMLRRRKYDKVKQADTDALLAELEALRALKAEKDDAASEEKADTEV